MSLQRGRFAPSPTGPLHFGSLIAALGSYLAIRSQGGEWLVRMEDLDKPRELPGAAADILRTLEALGLLWDGPVVYQSQRDDLYHDALRRLQPWIYSCTCSRRQVAQIARLGSDGPIYPGQCRGSPTPTQQPYAWRIRTDDKPISFQDGIQGLYTQRLESEVGDFVVRRADGLFAYQLAVVVDDAEQGISQVVRGCDLLNSTHRQIYLQRLLELPTPAYSHLPLVFDAQGNKLSKQTGATALDLRQPAAMLVQALEFLGQQPPPDLARAKPTTVLAWAIAHWQPARIHAIRTAPTTPPTHEPSV